MKLRTLLFLAAAAPLASAVAMSVILTRDAVDQFEQAEALNASVAHSAILSELVHELQRERGFSAGFVGSSGAVFTKELAEQRKAADQALTPIRRMGGADLSAFQEHIAQLDEIRTNVSKLAIKVPAVAAFYTQGIKLLQDVIAHDIGFLKDPEAADAADFLLAILNAKEFAGLERAMGAVGFGSGGFPPAIEAKFFRFAHSQNAILDMAAADVRAETRDEADPHLHGAARRRVEALRAIVSGAEGAPAVATVSGPEWFKASSAWVDELKAASDVVGAILVKAAATMSRDAYWGLVFAVSLGGAALILSLALTFFILRRVQREITLLSSEMQRVADEEDLDNAVHTAVDTYELRALVRMTETFRGQAIARLDASGRAAALNELEQHRSKALSDVADRLNYGLSSIARGDLACQIHEPFDDGFDEIRRNFNSSLEKLNALVRRVGDKTWSLEEGSRAAETAADDLARRTETTSSSIEACGAASEALKSSIEEAAKSVNRASELAVTNQQRASEGHEVVENAVDAMARIELSSTKISDIVNIIDDIALQTKLLALNASVEAARAGEIGRGFGVVATEVQVLAQRSSESAKDIRDVITDSADAVATGVTLVRDTGACFAKITKDTSEISKLSSDIAEAGDIQMRSVHSLADSIGSVGRDIMDNAAVAEQLSGSAKSFSDASTDLAASLRAFNTDDEVELSTEAA